MPIIIFCEDDAMDKSGYYAVLVAPDQFQWPLIFLG
jgi:hypothetical protein